MLMVAYIHYLTVIAKLGQVSKVEEPAAGWGNQACDHPHSTLLHPDEGCDNVCGTCYHPGPCRCPWSALQSEAMWMALGYAAGGPYWCECPMLPLEAMLMTMVQTAPKGLVYVWGPTAAGDHVCGLWSVQTLWRPMISVLTDWKARRLL